MASSRIDGYKTSNRVDPRIKRRLRRSEEWQNKRDAEVNKLRNLGPMSPCRELDIDLSMDSSMIEATENSSPLPQISIKNNKTTKTRPLTPKLPKDNVPSKVETKIKQKNGKAATDAGRERYRMLQKWKEEKEIRKKQEALEKAKHKPFVVSSISQGKSNFERSWEQHKKTTKKEQAVPAAPPSRTTRAGAASSQRTTRQTTSAAKQVAAPPATKAAPSSRTAPATRATKAAPASRTAPATRATKAAPASRTAPATQATKAAPSRAAPATKVAPAPRAAPATRATRATAASKKVPPVQAEPVRRSTRASSKPDPTNRPSTKSKPTRNLKQTAAEAEFKPLEETPEEEEDVVEAKNSSKTSKSVSFAPSNFVFTTPEDLQPYDPWANALSPASARSFFSNSDHIPVDYFRSSNSPQLKNFVTTKRTHLFTEEMDGSVTETCNAVQEDEKDTDVAEFSLPESFGAKSHSPSLDKNVDVPSETPEQNSEAEPVAEKNVSVIAQEEPAAPSEELCEKVSPLKTCTPARVTRSSSFKTPVSEEPRTRTRKPRHSMSDTRKKTTKETRGRRKTETSRVPQSPEEWVELLKSSPMIEMTRRKYRKERLSTVPLNLQFDDDDLIAANIIPPKDSSSSEVDEKLPEQTPREEVESSETIVAMTESTPESIPEVESDVSPMEPSVVEPSIDSNPEQTATNTEDESVEKPIENPVKEMVSSEKIVSVTESTPEVETVKHDVAYFRNLIKSQTDSLNSYADKFEGDVQDVNDEVEGQIRTVIGKTKLLINKRFRQFIGLIDNCEFNTGEKETTCEDLQGFWDMVDFQVEDVVTQFEELQKMKENNWQPLETNLPAVKKPVKKLVKKVKPAAPKANTERKGKSKFAMFMAQKKKEVQGSSELKVSSPIPESKATESDSSLKVFDAGFFKVASPVKSPKPHCEGISKSPLVMPTFVETDRTVTTIGEENKMDSPKKAVGPEEEPTQIEPKSPLPNVQSPVASPLLPTKSLRRSFLPTVPSPLLQDITPIKKGRSQKSFVFTDMVSPMMTVRVPEQNPEEETDQEPAEKIAVLQTPPPRRSGRARTSVASYSPRPNVNKTPSQAVVMQSFLKMLGTESSSEGSQTLKDEEKSTEYPPVLAPLDNGNAKKKSTPRRKTVEPQGTDASPKRRRSTRLSRKSLSFYEEQMASDAKENATDISIKIDLPPSSKDPKSKRGNKKTKSVAFSEVTTVTIDGSPSTVLCPVSPNVDSNEEQQEDLIRKSGRFQSLKVGFTPVRSRPNLQSSPQTNKSGTDLMYSTP